jgi:hypothetical protein
VESRLGEPWKEGSHNAAILLVLQMRHQDLKLFRGLKISEKS